MHPALRAALRSAFCAIALLVPAVACAQVIGAVLAPPSRAFGLLVGDTLDATATVTVGAGTTLDAASLPAIGPVAPSVDIRAIEVGSSRAGWGSRYTIRVTYQDFAAPDHVAQIDVPAYTLVFRTSAGRVTAQIPAFSFAASPIQNVTQTSLDAASLRPDHAVLLMDVAGPRRLIAAGCAMAIAAAASLAVSLGKLPWPRRRGGPFTTACRAIAGERGAANPRAAFLLLHRAFDETAGINVFAEDLDAFFARQPRFGALREEIETFFAASRAFFFGAAGGDILCQPERLARCLARAERRL